MHPPNQAKKSEREGARAQAAYMFVMVFYKSLESLYQVISFVFVFFVRMAAYLHFSLLESYVDLAQAELGTRLYKNNRRD